MKTQPMTNEPTAAPEAGSLWGVPGKPETRRFVMLVIIEDARLIVFASAGALVAGYTGFEQWDLWVRESGAVDLTVILKTWGQHEGSHHAET